MKMALIQKYGTISADRDVQAQGIDNFLAAPCGCIACNDGVQSGHFACDTPPADVLRAEQRRVVSRQYIDGAWRWLFA